MEQQNKQPQQNTNLFSLPINGCLYIIILAAIAGMAVKGCKMVDMKYQEQKIKHEMIMDSLNTVKNNAIYQAKQKEK